MRLLKQSWHTFLAYSTFKHLHIQNLQYSSNALIKNQSRQQAVIISNYLCVTIQRSRCWGLTKLHIGTYIKLSRFKFILRKGSLRVFFFFQFYDDIMQIIFRIMHKQYYLRINFRKSSNRALLQLKNLHSALLRPAQNVSILCGVR